MVVLPRREVLCEAKMCGAIKRLAHLTLPDEIQLSDGTRSSLENLPVKNAAGRVPSLRDLCVLSTHARETQPASV
jgi:hypothetical protein